MLSGVSNLTSLANSGAAKREFPGHEAYQQEVFSLILDIDIVLGLFESVRREQVSTHES